MTPFKLREADKVPDHTHRPPGEGGDLEDYARLSRTSTQEFSGEVTFSNSVIASNGVTVGTGLTLNENVDEISWVSDGFIHFLGPGTTTDARDWRMPDRSGTMETVARPVASKTANYTLTVADELVLVDATAGAVTVTLPAVSGLTGRRFWVKKVDASGNAVTLDGNGAETIDGSATYALAAQWDAVRVMCSGTAWFVEGIGP